MKLLSAEATQSTPSTDPTVTVSMLDDHLVMSAPDQFDIEMTEVLVIAAASAVAAGSTVMIDLDPDTASDELLARRPLTDAAAPYVANEGGPVEILGAGYVRLATRDAHWTIDLARGRLCRSQDAIDPHFVRSDAWTQVQAVWVSQTSVVALTADGTYLTTQTAWTTERPTIRPALT